MKAKIDTLGVGRKRHLFDLKSLTVVFNSKQRRFGKNKRVNLIKTPSKSCKNTRQARKTKRSRRYEKSL